MSSTIKLVYINAKKAAKINDLIDQPNQWIK
jgi:hypothetical protein